MPDRNTTKGTLGDDVDRAAVGSGIQQVNLQIGDKSMADLVDLLRRLQTAVYGDMEAGMAGLVRRLELIQGEVKELTAQVKTLQGKVSVMEERMAQRRETSQAILVLLYVIMLMVLLLMGVTLWPFIFG
jgi:hypothetical protein